jgi:hypothetical protein
MKWNTVDSVWTRKFASPNPYRVKVVLYPWLTLFKSTSAKFAQ